MPNDAATYLVAIGPHNETTADNLWKDDALRSHSLSHKGGDEEEMQQILAAATGHADKEQHDGQ